MILERPTAFWKVINTNPNTAAQVVQAVSDALASPGAEALSTINLATALSRLAKALGAGAGHTGRAPHGAAEARGVRAAGVF